MFGKNYDDEISSLQADVSKLNDKLHRVLLHLKMVYVPKTTTIESSKLVPQSEYISQFEQEMYKIGLATQPTTSSKPKPKPKKRHPKAKAKEINWNHSRLMGMPDSWGELPKKKRGRPRKIK